MVLFVIAMGLVTFALAWAAWPIGCVVAGPSDRAGAIAIGITGTVAAAGFLGVALNPWNLRFAVHMGFVKLPFGSLLLFMLLVAFEELRNHWPWWDAAVCAVYAVALAAYFWNLLYGARLDTQRGVMTQSVLQKAIVYLSVLCLALIAWAVRTRVVSMERVPS
jgi:hypothetical protein